MCLPEVVSVSVNVLMDLQHPVTAVPVFKHTDRQSGRQRRQTHRQYSTDDDSALSAGDLDEGISGSLEMFGKLLIYLQLHPKKVLRILILSSDVLLWPSNTTKVGCN